MKQQPIKQKPKSHNFIYQPARLRTGPMLLDNAKSSQVQHYRNIGNQAVQRLLESRALQAKLKIGSPNDKYEQEADRVADKVMKMEEKSLVNGQWSLGRKGEESAQTKPLAEQITPLVQRQPEEEEEIQKKSQVQRQQEEEEAQAKLQRQPEEDEEEPVQTKSIQRQVDEEEEEEAQTKLQRQPEEEEEESVQSKTAPGSTPKVTSSIESGINSMKGGGQPLSESTRAFFEPRFGSDFSQVRVHTDSRAAQTAQAINAKAFTTGNDIVFNSSQYSPDTIPGKHLLAHELTHVLQQGNTGAINAKPQRKVRYNRSPRNTEQCTIRNKSISQYTNLQRTIIQTKEESNKKKWWGYVRKPPDESNEGEIQPIENVWGAIRALYGISDKADIKYIEEWVKKRNKISNTRSISGTKVVYMPSIYRVKTLLNQRRIEIYLRNEFLRKFKSKFENIKQNLKKKSSKGLEVDIVKEPKVEVDEKLPGGMINIKFLKSEVVFKGLRFQFLGKHIVCNLKVGMGLELVVKEKNPILKMDIDLGAEKMKVLALAEIAAEDFAHQLEVNMDNIRHKLKFIKLGVELTSSLDMKERVIEVKYAKILGNKEYDRFTLSSKLNAVFTFYDIELVGDNDGLKLRGIDFSEGIKYVLVVLLLIIYSGVSNIKIPAFRGILFSPINYGRGPQA